MCVCVCVYTYNTLSLSLSLSLSLTHTHTHTHAHTHIPELEDKLGAKEASVSMDKPSSWLHEKQQVQYKVFTLNMCAPCVNVSSCVYSLWTSLVRGWVREKQQVQYKATRVMCMHAFALS